MSKTKGFTKCSNNLLFHNNLSPISKLVFVGLSYYDRGRGCFCKRSTLAQMLNVSLYQLRKALTELLDAELILIHRRGYGKTSIIRVVANTETHAVPKTSPQINKEDEEEVKEEEFVSNASNKDVENNQEPQEEPQNGKKGVKTSRGAPNDIKPLPIHQETTERLHERLRDTIRPHSYSVWFAGKTCVSYEDNKSITIKCIDSFTASWLDNHYAGIIHEITGKSVAFHAKENRDG